MGLKRAFNRNGALDKFGRRANTTGSRLNYNENILQMIKTNERKDYQKKQKL
jgi:hypothetical protein